MHTSDRRTIRLVGREGWPKFLVGREMLVIGRDPTCDVRIDSPWISRRHCCLTEVDGEVLVRDLGSTNGTWINGRRVESGRLRPGDELSIATVGFCVVDGWYEDSPSGPIQSTRIAPIQKSPPPDPA